LAKRVFLRRSPGKAGGYAWAFFVNKTRAGKIRDTQIDGKLLLGNLRRDDENFAEKLWGCLAFV
jgi:hypothetical protein